MKSKIKSKKPIKWGQIIHIEKLYANESTVESFKDNLKKNRPDITEEQLNQEIQNMVMKDNFYNKVMDEIANSYVIDFDQDEINERINNLKTNYPHLEQEEMENTVKISIFKKIIYDDLVKEWEIEVTDDMARTALENFYKNTGSPIREYLQNPEKFNEVKETILEQIITDRIMNGFSANFNLNQKS